MTHGLSPPAICVLIYIYIYIGCSSGFSGRVLSLSWEDPLEKGMATHSSILAWEIPWTEEPSGLHSPWGRKELDMT